MTLDELKRESFYQQLSDGQQKFVIGRCSGLDDTTAAHKSWKLTSDASAKAMANKAMKNANVAHLINTFLGISASEYYPSQRELGEWLWDKAKNCANPSVALGYAKLFCETSGYKTKAVDPPGKPPVDDSNEDFEL